MSPTLFDVVIIGGGPGGLSIATALARQTHTAVVLDSGRYRNAVSKHMHNVPGFDHVDPAEFRAKAKADLVKRYKSIEFQTTEIKEVKRADDGTFEVSDGQGAVWRGKKLGLGSGVRDRTEDEVKGYEECWGRGIFHCLFCHGFEERGTETAGFLVNDMMTAPTNPMPPADMITHVSRMAKRLAKNVIIYTNGRAELVDELKAKIHSSKIIVDNRVIDHLSLVGEGPHVKITFEDGTTKTEGFLASHPKVEQRAGSLVEQLGLEMTPGGDIKANPPMNETSVKGVFAVGDAATPIKSVMQAMYMGMFAGVGMVTQLQIELELKDEL
ncbi:uncharacterized protein F5Z01DRAFT_671622 [Emericellopsis atlantica]|uniref:FAD/NAD(P)-binding domain-containing protein n=1 Tax=Emericellopsis atlantica TaxID=2614577 RepID=A0A9P7ZT33_9HYPO|nr:uncharacterized protein F5Z01DRAFT_671622 [Emericellopsis atlantica]KAG9257180.1 hypothetical protein F5Z01DRAFT_671622 [Emericellopsis atlantica]